MEDGAVYPNCCPDWVEFPLGNLLEQPWDEVWNGAKAQALRQSMLDGDLRYCDGSWCPHIQNARRGIADHNVVPHDQLGTFGLGPERQPPGLEMAAGPVNVGMHHDWSCNLACPTCRADVQMVSGEDAERMGRLHDIVERDILGHPGTISLTGTGDPFASKFLRDFLIRFDRATYPNIENIHLHTNAILWTPRLWARMPGLSEVKLSTDISIDAACAETYHVVRRPARWDRLMENLDFIAGIPNLHTLGVSMTVSSHNIAELVAFHELAQRLAAQCPDKHVFVEFKRVRRRDHHGDAEWHDLGLEHLDRSRMDLLLDQLRAIDDRRRSGAGPQIRSNLDELFELGA